MALPPAPSRTGFGASRNRPAVAGGAAAIADGRASVPLKKDQLTRGWRDETVYVANAVGPAHKLLQSVVLNTGSPDRLARGTS
jgi:hypothetical protein